ncbi:MAG TPA: AMP-binding protein [Acidimicrobiia bacterium]
MSSITTSASLSDLVDRRAATDADGPCLADSATPLTNADLLERVLAAARLFADLGVGRGDVVAVMLPNRVELLVTLFATWRLGAAVTPINPALTPAEATHQLTDSGAKVLVNGDGASVSDGVVSVAADVLAGKTSDGAPGDRPGDRAGTRDAGPVVDPRPVVDPLPIVDPGALALLIYTSGTTGQPKGVMLDHTNVAAMCAMAADALRITAADHSLLILPLFHVNGIIVGSLTPLLAGGRVTIGDRFDPATFFGVVERVRPTYFSAVPTIYTMLSTLPDDVAPDTSSLRLAICGAAPMPAELIGRFEARYGVPIVEGYGLSEGACASTVNPVDGPRKPGTVGLPMPGQQVITDSPDGPSSASPNSGSTVGEVLIKGPNVMRGYLGRPEETATTIVDGWLHTGDVGRFDEDGYLVLVDRIKDMIIRAGENIYPKEIENVLYAHPDVLEAAVVGAPNETYGEVPVAFVTLRPGATVNAEGLRDHCRERLSKYKLPAVELLAALPKNAVGKIDKPTLRAGLAAG